MKRLKKWQWTALAAALLGLGAWWWFRGPDDDAARRALAPVPRVRDADATRDEMFGLTRVHKVHLTLTPDEYDAMQPIGGRGPGGPRGRAAVVEPAELPDGRDASLSNFGTTFPWAHADLEFDDKRFADVGVRYKGNASYMASARGLKRSLKVDLQQFHDGGKLHGEKKLNLHAAAMDPTKCREAIAYAVFRAAKVPAPRTAFAEVELTVGDRHDRERLGLYVLVEQVDKGFLKTHFGDGGGLLLKPEQVHSFDYLGEAWSAYEARYSPDDPATPEQSRRVIDFARLIHREDDERFRDEIESYLDVEGFLRFVATSGLLSNLDSFLAAGHNYYVYLHPQTQRFAFIPWDMDLALAGFPMGGSAAQQADLSLAHPHADNKLIDRVLAIPKYRARYDELLDEILADAFTRGRLIAYVEDLEAVTLSRLERDQAAALARGEQSVFSLASVTGGPPRSPAANASPDENGSRPAPPTGGPPGGPGPTGFGPPLRTFIVQRFESIEAQLAGTRTGYTPSRMGPPGGPAGPEGRGGPGVRLGQAIAGRADLDGDGRVTADEFERAALDAFDAVDPEGRETLDEHAVERLINGCLPPPPTTMFANLGFGPPGGGPGRFMAGPLLDAADENQDGEASRDEWRDGARTLFERFAGGDESLTVERFAEEILGVLPPPPGMGPPDVNDSGRPRGERQSRRSPRDSDRPERPRPPRND